MFRLCALGVHLLRVCIRELCCTNSRDGAAVLTVCHSWTQQRSWFAVAEACGRNLRAAAQEQRPWHPYPVCLCGLSGPSTHSRARRSDSKWGFGWQRVSNWCMARRQAHERTCGFAEPVCCSAEGRAYQEWRAKHAGMHKRCEQCVCVRVRPVPAPVSVAGKCLACRLST